MMTDRGGKPKNRTAGTTETGRNQTPGLQHVAITVYQGDVEAYKVSGKAILLHYSWVTVVAIYWVSPVLFLHWDVTDCTWVRL